MSEEKEERALGAPAAGSAQLESTLRAVVEFAFENGFHEVGYDVVGDALEAARAQGAEAMTRAAEAWKAAAFREKELLALEHDRGLEDAALYLERKWTNLQHDHESPGSCSLCHDVSGIRSLSASKERAQHSGDDVNRRLSDLLMDCVDWAAKFPEAKADPRAWGNLLIYAPREALFAALRNDYRDPRGAGK